MHVAYVLNTYPQPSHSFIRREIRALEAQGVAVTRLAMRGPTGKLVDPMDREEQNRTRYVLAAGAVTLALATLVALLRAPTRFLAAVRQTVRAGRASPVGVLRHLIYLAEAAYVASVCRGAGADHVHAHFGTNAAVVAMLSHTLGGPSYSFTVHGPEEFDAPVALSLPEKIAGAAFVVGVSRFGRSQLCRWAPYALWDKLKVVHCGIDPEAFASPVPLPEGPLRLVSIGRFHEQKGQMVLIEAMVRLRRSHPDVHLTLVGDGELRPEIETEIARHGLGEAITLAGWLSERGVNAALAEAHCLVMPSFAEGLPMVIMEAMAAARPVIATYVAGIPELVKPGETGWLVPAGDAGALAEVTAKAAKTPRDSLKTMGQAGRKRALERHDIHTEAARLKAYFTEAMR